MRPERIKEMKPLNIIMASRPHLALITIALLTGCMQPDGSKKTTKTNATIEVLSKEKSDFVTAPLSGNYNELLRFNRENSPSVRKARAEFEAAQSAILSSKGQLGPTLSANAEDYQLGDLDRSATLQVRQPIWYGGQLNQDVKRAELKAQLAQLEFEVAQNASAHKFVTLYFQWLRSISEEKLRQIYLDQLTNVLQDIEKEFEIGLVGQSEFVDAQIRLDQSHRRLLLVQSQRQNAFAALESYLLTTQNEDLLYAKRPSITTILQRNEDVEKVVSKDPTVLAAKKYVEITEADILLRRLDGRPQVDLVAKRQWTGAGGVSDGAGIALNLTIVNPRAKKARIEELENTLNATIASVDAARADLLVNILQAERSLESNNDRIKVLSEIVSRAEDALASAERQKRAGTGSWDVVITGITELSELKVSMSEATMSAYEAAEHLRLYLEN